MPGLYHAFDSNSNSRTTHKAGVTAYILQMRILRFKLREWLLWANLGP